MTKFSSNPARRLMAAAVGGLLLSASFAPLRMAWAAWIGPGLILFSALGTPGRQAFRIGFVAGWIHFLSSLYWLLHMPLTWHGIPLAPAAGWLALSAYCALYPALWVWLCWKFFPGNCATPDQFIATGWVRRLAWAFAAGSLWTVLEYVRGTFLTGFPWNFVAASQYQILSLIQIAAVTGIYGVTFLVVWTSVSLCATALILARRPFTQTLWVGAGLPLLAVAGVASFGLGKTRTIPTPPRELTVAMIQPSIPQTLIWDPAADKVRFKNVIDLSEQALASHSPQLLLWPESAVPDLAAETQEAIGRLAQTYQTWLVFCAGTAVSDPTGGNRYFNSALLCNPSGMIESVYNKRRLVIFGEYTPLVRWLPFLKWLTSVEGELTAGDHAVEFEMKNPSAKMSVLICFEDMFAQEAREHVGPDTDFLVNLTNDGWFGHGPEQWQQAASGIFRAVENGVPLLRCTNDGLTCWADAQGRMRQLLKVSGSVYGPGFITAQIPLRALSDRSQTFYNQHGDWFPCACSGIALAWLMAAVWNRRRSNISLSLHPE